jgi:hypothetical protein
MSDDAVERMLDEKPLIAFSVYTAGQVDVLNETAQTIVSTLESSIRPDGIDGLAFNRAYGLFWLWVLGAYEVARTMCQARECFSSPASRRICTLKRHIAKLRIPFAKQEYEGPKKPIQGEASVTGFNLPSRDFSFDVKGTRFSVRKTMDEFRAVIASIGRADVLRDHRSSYARPANSA